MKRLLSFVAIFFLAAALHAGTVRGMILRNNQPWQGVTVTIIAPGIGRSSPAFTGPDGMYYEFNVPPGQYTLEIWINGTRAQPMMYPITVFNQPYTDLPVLRY